MKISTCGISPRSGSEMPERGIKMSTVLFLWTNLRNFSARSKWFPVVNGDRKINVVITYGLETKQQSMEWRYSGSPCPQKNSECRIPLQKFSRRLFGIKTPSALNILQRAEYYSFLRVQFKDILREKRRRKFTKGRLLLARQCLGSPGTYDPEESGLPGLPVSWSLTPFSRSVSVGLSSVPWTEKNNWKFAIFRPTRRSLLPRRPVWTDNLVIFFFLVTCKSYSNGPRNLLSFVRSMLNKS